MLIYAYLIYYRKFINMNLRCNNSINYSRDREQSGKETSRDQNDFIDIHIIMDWHNSKIGTLF